MDESRCRCEEPVKRLMNYREKLLVPNPILLELPKPETRFRSRQRRGRWKCKDQQEKSRRRRCMYSCAGVTHHRNDAHVCSSHPKTK